MAAAYGFRGELPTLSRCLKLFAIPALLGGLVGAKLMLWGGDKVLYRLVPWLILAASLLFLLQEPIMRKIASLSAPQRSEDEVIDSLFKHAHFVVVFVFLVSIYGGYFGAGMGILMLAALGFMGFSNIHQMNGLKNLLAASINLVATITFIFAGRIDWFVAALMATGAVLGGLFGARLALRVGQKAVRQTVIVIGFSIAGWFFLRQYHQ
jgi:uncharacterized membrane protein YfcA